MDKVEKREVYERCGVKECHIVHPLTKEVVTYTLVEDRFSKTDTEGGRIASALLGLTVTF